MYGIDDEIVNRLEERYEIEELVEALGIEEFMFSEYGTDDFSDITVREICKLKKVQTKIKKKLNEGELDIQ